MLSNGVLGFWGFGVCGGRFRVFEFLFSGFWFGFGFWGFRALVLHPIINAPRHLSNNGMS